MGFSHVGYSILIFLRKKSPDSYAPYACFSVNKRKQHHSISVHSLGYSASYVSHVWRSAIVNANKSLIKKQKLLINIWFIFHTVDQRGQAEN